MSKETSQEHLLLERLKAAFEANGAYQLDGMMTLHLFGSVTTSSVCNI